MARKRGRKRGVWRNLRGGGREGRWSIRADICRLEMEHMLRYPPVMSNGGRNASEALASFGVMGDRLRDPLNPSIPPCDVRGVSW